MAITDNYIQVAADGSGKKVRNLEMVVVLPTGAEHVVEVQVVAHIGADGHIVDVDTSKLLAEVQEMREQIDALKELWTEALTPDLRQTMANKNGRHCRASKEN